MNSIVMGGLTRMTSSNGASSRGSVWSLLRRTRYRLIAAVRTNPLHAQVLGPVIDAMATAEATLIAEDSTLPRRKGRGPRGGSEVAPQGDEHLLQRIEELERAVRIREEHIAIVAHDLRNPLSPILLIVNRLLEEVRARDVDAIPTSWLRGRIESVSTRLGQFVGQLNRLLDATRLQTGHLALEPEQLDLVDVVTDLIEATVTDSGGHANVRLDAAQPVRGSWDRLRVEQIVRNLLSNAVRYGAGQPVDVSVTTDGPNARIAVRDRGQGIPPDEQARVFERYTRLARNGSGLGLGLWIVRELCTAMGGTVTIDSTVGGGSTFTVTIPRT